MSPQDWIILIILGGILGMVGQGIRIAAGIKKMNDQASSTGATAKEMLAPHRMVISLIIGFVAGVLGAVGLEGATAEGSSEFSGERIVTLIGIGYAGTDFIEAFMSKHIAVFGKRSQPEGARDMSAAPQGQAQGQGLTEPPAMG